MRLSFPTPTIGTKWAYAIHSIPMLICTKKHTTKYNPYRLNIFTVILMAIIHTGIYILLLVEKQSLISLSFSLPQKGPWLTNEVLFHTSCMYVWSSHIAEYGSNGYGCQTCSAASCIFPCHHSRLSIGSRETGSRVPRRCPHILSNAIGSWRSLPRGRRRRASCPQGTRANKEWRTGEIRGAFFQGCTGLWTAGCWLARRLHQLKPCPTMDLGISIFLIFA